MKDYDDNCIVYIYIFFAYDEIYVRSSFKCEIAYIINLSSFKTILKGSYFFTCKNLVDYTFSLHVGPLSM